MPSGRKTVRPMGFANAVLLPGHYECLTTQLNITHYRAGGAGRFVCVTRMPSDDVETKRTIGDTGPWRDVHTLAEEALSSHLYDAMYLMGWSFTDKGTAPPLNP